MAKMSFSKGNDMFKEKVTLTGRIILDLYGPDGKLKDHREINNLVVTAGKNFAASWLAASAASMSDQFMKYVAIGTGTGAAAAGDTALGAEVGTRVAGTISSSTNIWQHQATFAAGNGTAAITEAGLFNALTSGTMLARQVFSAVNKAAADSLVLTWQITIS